MEGGAQQQSSGLFAVFVLSIYSLFLIPYTIHYLCSAGEEGTTQPVAKGKKKPSAADRLKNVATKGNLVLLLMWVAWMCIIAYSQASMADMKPFDPFDILGVTHDASERDIKKAYRKLSLQYHPDKNPDPAAASYFASHITKAYAALTDEASRANYEKYGHPDGPQGMNLGVALPSWMFARDKATAPLMLFGLVGIGILAPLGLLAWYMLSSSKVSGPHGIMNDSLAIFAFSKHGIKESQSLVRIPETLLCAMEFITLYTPADHNVPMEELRKSVGPAYADLMNRSNKTFWHRKASIIKAHMLLLAHLERMGDEVPAALQADLKYVRTKAPQLCEEMLKIAVSPRSYTNPYGWMTPSVACVEMMQCLAQALPIGVRKGGPKGGPTSGGDGPAGLLALPGVDGEVLKKLRKRKITSLAELQALGEGARMSELTWAGLSASDAEGVSLALSAMPRLRLALAVQVDEPDGEVQQGDEVHCRVRVLLSRPSHASEGYALRGSSVRAYTPHNPVPRDEAWHFFLVDTGSNTVWAWKKVNLMEAERAGLAHPQAFDPPPGASAAAPTLPASGSSSNLAAANGAAPAAAAAPGGGKPGSKKGGAEGGEPGSAGDGDDVPGQEVDLAFVAVPKPGVYNLTLLVMSDCWVGADEAVPVKLRINPPVRLAQAAAAEAREALAARRGRKHKAAASDSGSGSDSDDDASGSGSDSDSGSGSGSGSGSDSDDDYDSEETGEEESDASDDDGKRE